MRVFSEAARPSASTLEVVRRTAARLQPGNPMAREWVDAYRNEHVERVACDVDQLLPHLDGATEVLELGSLPLLLTASLHGAGTRVIGVDVDPSRMADVIVALGLSVVRCDIESEPLPFPDDRFDIVVANELFEHLRINPIFTLREALRVLRPGGRLFLSTPNLRSLRGLYNFLVRHEAHSCLGDVYAQYENLERRGHMGHTREYTVREVTRFLARVGFEVEGVVYRGQFPGRLPRLITRLRPSLRPFFSCVARKPSTDVTDKQRWRAQMTRVDAESPQNTLSLHLCHLCHLWTCGRVQPMKKAFSLLPSRSRK